MQKSGIESIRKVDVNSPSPSGTTYEYRGKFRIPKITKQAQIGGVGTRTVEIPANELPITGLVSIWKDGSGTAYAGGGAFPAKDYEESDRITVTSSKHDGIDLGVYIDLNLGPDQLRRNVIHITESISTK